MLTMWLYKLDAWIERIAILCAKFIDRKQLIVTLALMRAKQRNKNQKSLDSCDEF